VPFKIKPTVQFDRLSAALFGKFRAVKAKHSSLKDKIRGRLIRNTEFSNETLQIKKFFNKFTTYLKLSKNILGVIARTIDP